MHQSKACRKARFPQGRAPRSGSGMLQEHKRQLRRAMCSHMLVQNVICACRCNACTDEQQSGGGFYLVVQMVQQANRQQSPVEVGLLLKGSINASLQLWSLKDEGSRHTDEHRDESSPGVHASAAQVLDVAHGPAREPGQLSGACHMLSQHSVF